MALLPAKTYSRRNNELSAVSEREKENIDPFDELLSSPLKQDVQFMPLSFWGQNIKDIESKKKSKTNKYRLYEISDSDEHDSPFHRKPKPKSRSLVSKRPLLSKEAKLNTRRKNNSTAYSFIKKSHKNVSQNESNSLKQIEVPEKNNKSQILSKTLYLNENMEETLKECDNFKYDSARSLSIDDTTGNFSNYLHSVEFKGNNQNSRRFSNKKINQKNFKFKVYEDFDASQKRPVDAGDNTLLKEGSLSSTMQFSDNLEETLKSFYEDKDIFKFISVKRHFNYPHFHSLPDANFNCLLNSIGSSEIQEYRVPSEDISKHSSDSRVEESMSVTVNCMNDSDKIFSVANDVHDDDGVDDDDDDNDDDAKYFINSTLLQTSSENMTHTLDSLNSTTVITEESDECSKENTFSDSFDFGYFKNINLKDLIEELLVQQNANIQNNETVDSISTSDEGQSELNDEDTVIRIALESETNNVSSQGSEEKEIIYSASPSSGVSQLESKISNLTISNATELETGKSSILPDYSSDKEDSFLVDMRNVTTKRRGFLNSVHEGNMPRTYGNRFRFSSAPNKTQRKNDSELDLEFDQTFKLPPVSDRMSLDWNKTVSFTNPIFESTRVLDMSVTDKKVPQEQQLPGRVLEESAFDHTYVLKPGKKWQRSMSILKQLQNRNITESRLESTKITGRKFESFVQDMMEMQSGINKTCIGVSDRISFSKGLSEYQKVLSFPDESETSEFFSANDSLFTKSTAVSEKFFNRTVKVIQPDEVSSSFRSALGLETSHVTILEDSAREGSFCLSARDFILIQCGQEDVLPFEEYFNERTLTNCKKIGEGVYGEVFMSSDSVIKIIPIEGSDKVNGESQKTFEEIISEVVIASKLSNLRNGKKHQTDGFSEMKRCWCVKGKYPKYLLRLWNEYDQLGSGSENDSPVMFKDDQLYIILELANGGKDLESFVFNSAAQSLSVFIQVAFSLAVAEKAFEFEHRDLHWGNVLISETKDKYMTVILDDTEYKIPTKGVKVCIIDFTLSRMSHEGCCIFNDLSVDPGLFTSEGDYQFEIYRMMLREVKNDWSLFRPRNNLFWLHYTLDKMIKMVRYKNKKAKIHAKHLKDLKTLESVVLEHKDSTEFVMSSCLSSLINKL